MKKVSKEKIAQIYAKALLDSAKSATDAKIVCKQAKELAEFLVEDKNIVSYFSSPMFSQKDKFEALNETSKKMGLCDELKRFLQIVIENNRFCEIENMLETYAKLFAEKNGYIYVTVQSVKELSKKQDKEMLNKLQSFEKKNFLTQNRTGVPSPVPFSLLILTLFDHQLCFIASATMFWCMASTFLLPWVLLP